MKLLSKKTGAQQSKKGQFIVFGMCSLLALVLCMVTLVITVNQVESEGVSAEPEQQTLQNKTQLDNKSPVLAEYISELVDKTHNNKFIKVNSFTDISVDDDKIVVTDEQGDSVDPTLLIYAKNKILGVADSWYGADYTGVFGTAYDKMPVVELTSHEGVKGSFTTGLADDNGQPVYNDEGELVDGDCYYVTFVVVGEMVTDNSLSQAFRLDQAPDAGKKITEEISSVCQVSRGVVTPGDFKITAKVNRVTDEIVYIEITRLYNISARLDFKGDMESFGTADVQLEYKVTEHFDYYYAGISFTDEQISADVGGEVALTVNAVIEDDSEYKVHFTSSDESVVTVDEMGYATVHKESAEPVYVTVTLEYLGERFTDKCAINVRTEEA